LLNVQRFDCPDLTNSIVFFVDLFVSVLISKRDENKGKKSTAHQVVVRNIDSLGKFIPFCSQSKIADTCRDYSISFKVLPVEIFDVIQQILVEKLIFACWIHLFEFLEDSY
jgi:hypothetical protein